MRQYSFQELEENFSKVHQTGANLTTVGFDRISEIKTKTYCSYYCSSWFDVVRRFGASVLLYSYVKSEYQDFCLKTGKVGLSEFTKHHEYITAKLIYSIGFDQLKSDCSIPKQRYTDDQYESNFKYVCGIVNDIPLYHEFQRHSKISLLAYTHRFKLTKKPYLSLVQRYVSDVDLQRYLLRYSQHKHAVGQQNAACCIEASDDELRQNFTNIMDEFLNEHGVLPSKKLFNQISKYDESTYRRRYGLSWIDVCARYGYAKDKAHTSEKILLDNIKQILVADYEPQKQFDWLRGNDGGYLRCDGFFHDLNIVIEFDGAGHRVPIKKFGGIEGLRRTKLNDDLKDKLLKEHHIRCIRIDSRSNWYDIGWLTDYLNTQLNEVKHD